MYAISNASRVYITSFFLLCAAFFLAPTLANANEYWSTYERRMISQSEVSNRVNRMLSQATSMPSNATLSTVPSAPTVTKNSLGGLSATTNNILKTLDQPSSFSSTLNNSVGSAQTALKSCLRSPVCATRALGTAGVLYEGIQGWKEVYSVLTDADGRPVKETPLPVPPSNPNGTCRNTHGTFFESCAVAFSYDQQNRCSVPDHNVCPLTFERTSDVQFTARGSQGQPLYIYRILDNACPSGSTNTENGCVSNTEKETKPVPYGELDQMIDEGYDPAVSDAPIVLLSGEPETISLTTPDPANLPATTTTSTDSQGKTTTTVENAVITYSVLNNNSSSPSIESTVTETTNTYDETANLVGSMTSTTTNNPVAPYPLTPPSSGASADIELPPFCTYASIVCDWIGWTKEGIEGEEPDLINLISEFEPEEQQYNSGIGSGSCPAPMTLNLGIINRTVEVSYQPFCDFLDMIRPLVIAGAWLLSAFMYVGVLRRG